MYDRYERLGIWGQPTSQPSGLEKAMNVTSGFQNIFGKQYNNIIDKYRAQDADLNNQYKSQTLGSTIDATNTKNQADIQNYPLQQAAKTAQEQQTIKEIMSRTGLNYAQAAEAGARTGLIGTQTQQLRQSTQPGYAFDEAQRQFNASPDGSPRKMYFGGILNSLMGAPGGMNLGGRKTKDAGLGGVSAGGAAGGGMVQGADGNISLNPLGGGPRSAFHQGFYDSPDNGQQTIESPTTASATRNQTRLEAHNEIGGLYPQITDGLKPYQGPMGSLNLMYDSYKASNGDADAKQKLTNYAIAKRFLPELAAVNARQATGTNPGIELTREFQGSMFPGLPGSMANYFIPSNVQAQANTDYLPMQGKAVESAINQERTGYPTAGAPDFARTNQNFGYFDGYGYHSPDEIRQNAQAAQGNQQNQQQNSRPTEADIAYTAKLHGVTPAEVRKRLGIN